VTTTEEGTDSAARAPSDLPPKRHPPQCLHLLSQGTPVLFVAALEVESVHQIVGEGGYRRLLTATPDLTAWEGPALVITPSVLYLRLDAFTGILGGTPMLWRLAGLAAPSHAGPALLTQGAHWLAAVRKQPACVDPTVGNVGMARAALAARIARWPEPKLSRLP
jgi:hypothetical protein